MPATVRYLKPEHEACTFWFQDRQVIELRLWPRAQAAQLRTRLQAELEGEWDFRFTIAS